MEDAIATIVGIGGATTVAGFLVSMFKLARPTASASLIVLAAFVSGQASSVLVTAASGGLAMSQKTLSVMIVTGIMAAAAAAGLSRTEQTAEAKRIGKDVQTQREVVADQGAKAEKEIEAADLLAAEVPLVVTAPTKVSKKRPTK